MDQATSSTQKSKTLNVQGGGTLSAKYYTGPGDGVLTTPGAPVLPLYAKGAKAAGTGGYLLRGVGFTGGRYADSTVTPLTGAPGTELQSAHTSFNSPTFYPAQMWSANYFDALGGSGGVTLFTTPAQHRAPAPGSDTVTLRLYDNLKLRLFYSNSLADGAKSAPPVIYGVTSDLEAGDTVITARVVGDPKADVQQVWVTFTEPGSGLWQSFDLVRSRDRPEPVDGLEGARRGDAVHRPGGQRLRPGEPERQLRRLLPGGRGGLDARGGRDRPVRTRQRGVRRDHIRNRNPDQRRHGRRRQARRALPRVGDPERDH